MSAKKYYAARKGILPEQSIDFETLKKIILMKYQELEKELYFQEATGYKCVDKKEPISGIWGNDIETYIYTKIKLKDIWPIEEKIHNYDEPVLFTVIEFLYDYVSEPIAKYKGYHEWDDCGWHCSKFDKEKGQEKFRIELNEIIKDYEGGYQLTKEGELQNLPSTGFEQLIEETIQTDEPGSIDDRIKYSKSKYFNYGSTNEDKKEAIRTLADVLEFLKKEGVTLPSKDDSDLFQIINRFDIRHHNRDQVGDYDRELWNDWMFYTFLSSIKVLIKIKEKTK